MRGLFSRPTNEGVIDLHGFVVSGLLSRPTNEGVIDLHGFIVCGLFSRPTNEGVIDLHSLGLGGLGVTFVRPSFLWTLARPVSSGGCKSLPSIRNSLPIGARELEGNRTHLPACTLPVGVRVVCHDGLGASTVPIECGTCRYACYVLGFHCRLRISGPDRGCDLLTSCYLSACEASNRTRASREKDMYLLAPRVSCVLVEETRNYNNV